LGKTWTIRSGGTGRRRSKYGIRLLKFFLVCLIVVAVALFRLYVVLDDYEKHSPNRALDVYFALLTAGDFAKMEQMAGFVPDAMNSSDDYKAYLQQKFGPFLADGLSYRRSDPAGLTAGQRQYSIYSGEDRLGAALLTPNEDAENGWTVNPLFEYLPGYTVTAPEGAVVAVNALTLSQERIVDRRPVTIRYMREAAPVAVEIFQSMNDPSAAPQTVDYETDPSLLEPRFSARIEDGRQCETAVDVEARTVLVTVPPDAEQREAFARRMELVAKAYSDFITEDGSLSALRPYLHPDTSLYKNFSEYQVGWYLNHEIRTFSDFSVSDIAVRADDCFTGHIDFTVTVVRAGNVHVFNASYDMGFVRVDDKWLLAGLHARSTDAQEAAPAL
jgi:hypothetical protein